MALFDNPSELNRMALKMELEINKLEKELETLQYYAHPSGMTPLIYRDINGQRYRFIGVIGEYYVYKRTHQFGPGGNVFLSPRWLD